MQTAHFAHMFEPQAFFKFKIRENDFESRPCAVQSIPLWGHTFGFRLDFEIDFEYTTKPQLKMANGSAQLRV